MSKTTADVAKLLSASNEQLFDRYINVTLAPREAELSDPDAPKPTVSGGTVSSPAPADVRRWRRTVVASRKNRFTITMPMTGIKPHIAVKGTFNAQETVHSIVVTIYNISEQIDTMAYNWAEVEAGYYNSGIHATFRGQIISCYMAKPNPNGELVVVMSLAHLTGLYKEGAIAITYSKKMLSTSELLQETMSQICSNVSDDLAIALKPDRLVAALPVDWSKRQFYVGEHSIRHFRSIFAVITWLNSLFATYTYGTTYAWGAGNTPIAEETKDSMTGEVKYKALSPQLTPIKLSFDSAGWLTLTGSYDDNSPAATKALSVIGSAFFSGDAATVTAPFNPDILPGDVIFIDVKYFRTRVSMEGAARERLASLGNMWKVISSDFVFDSQSTNRMVLTLNNLSNIIHGGA